jgi:microcystin-dependent protein
MDPFLGQIQAFGFNFTPRGWAQCDGQLLPVSSNAALFSLLGTTYGGDGRTTFALPDLRGRVPINQGTGPGLSPRQIGARSGVERTTLTVLNLPAHSHGLALSSAPGTTQAPGIPAVSAEDVYATTSDTTRPTSTEGAGQAFDHMPPFLVINWCIAINGIFPSRS